MYKVIVKIPIKLEKRCAYKLFNLPFAPFEGLTITHKTKKGEIDDIIIKEVKWDYDKKCFVCYQSPDYDLRPMAEVVDEYIEADWLFKPLES